MLVEWAMIDVVFDGTRSMLVPMANLTAAHLAFLRKHRDGYARVDYHADEMAREFFKMHVPGAMAFGAGRVPPLPMGDIIVDFYRLYYDSEY